MTIELDTDEDADRVIELIRSFYERDDREALGGLATTRRAATRSAIARWASATRALGRRFRLRRGFGLEPPVDVAFASNAALPRP